MNSSSIIANNLFDNESEPGCENIPNVDDFEVVDAINAVRSIEASSDNITSSMEEWQI